MILRVVLAAVFGGLLLFVLGAVSWIALPFHGASLHTPPQDAAVVDGFLEGLPDSGVYHWPGFPDDPDAAGAMEETFARMERGPNIAMMVVHKQGAPPFAPSRFAAKLALDVGATGLAAVLLALGAVRRRYVERVAFVAGLGLFQVLSGLGPEWLWWGYPLDFALPYALDAIVGWSLVGLVVAALVRPSAASASG